MDMSYSNIPIVRGADRFVLAEIKTKGLFLSPTDPRQDFNRSTNDNLMNSTNVVFGSEHGYTHVSQDELVIRQRGLSKTPLIFSPDIDVTKQSEEKLSEELDSDLKDIPRKRLLYDDPLELFSFQNDNSSSTDPKQKGIVTKIKLPGSNCLVSALKALTKNQLIEQITIDHPNIEKEIRSDFPVADLKLLENQISDLYRSIYTNLPKNKQISKTGKVSYYKVAGYVLEFKKCVIDEGRLLVDKKLWPTVMEYVFMAWKYVYKTPMWDLPVHNATRIQCFKSLSSMCWMALKNMIDTLCNYQCKIYENQLLTLKYFFTDEDDKGLCVCLQLLNKQT